MAASNDVIHTSGSVDLDVTVTTEDGDANYQILPFTVTDQLDILGTNAINSLQLTIRNNPVKVHVDNIRTIRSHQHLQESCLQICKEFPDLWKPELGCLKDYSLEVKFKTDVTPDSASREQNHSLCKITSNKPMMSESRREFGNLRHSMNMVRLWSQYVSRASPTNHLAMYECVGTTPFSSMASWRRTASLCHYQRT